MIGREQKPAKALEVYHNGQKIGRVETYRGQKDGPKINAAGVVAWRRDAVQYKANLDNGMTTSFRHPDAKDAVRSVIQNHIHSLRRV